MPVAAERDEQVRTEGSPAPFRAFVSGLAG